MMIELASGRRIAQTSSKGNQEKWLSGGRWYKLDQFGYEGLAETLVSMLLERSAIETDTPFRFVRYQMERMYVHGFDRTGCSSPDFSTPGQAIITLNHLLSRQVGKPLVEQLSHLPSDKKRIEYLAYTTAELTGLTEFPAYLTLLFEVDALFLNDDRHLNNIAVLEHNTHVPFPQIPDGKTVTGERIFNAGTHVQTDVSCNTEGQCFIIEVDPDKTVRAKKVITGNLRFYRKEVILEAGKMEQILSRELSDLGDDSVVDLILTGAVSAEEYEDRAAMMDRLLSRFIEGGYRDTLLSKLISKELIESEFPETSFSAALLTSLLDKPKEAQLVYELLQSLKGGK